MSHHFTALFGKRDKRRVHRLSSSSHQYVGYADLAGPVDAQLESLNYRRLIVGANRWKLGALLAANGLAVLTFIVWILAQISTQFMWPLDTAVSCLVLGIIMMAELLRLAQTCGLCIFAFAARDPIPLEPPTGLRVAVLTTIVPEQEPIEMVTETLRAMRQLLHDGSLDVWILDEGDDPAVREAATRLGVRHFTRKGQPNYNTASGQFRARTKAGNHNAWRVQHGTEYDIVAQVDPDHIPNPQFLSRTLGYFRDPDVAFVVAPQVYGNARENFVARAAAAQGYVFTGIVQRGGNGLDVPLLIGTNHLYRMRTWTEIEGYQDSIIEDHLTSMVVHGSVNAATSRRWRGVYTPDILAVGEGPATWTDFFRQQDRWASGVWQILLHRRPMRSIRMTTRQRLAYAFLQSFYPTVGLCWTTGNLATMAYLTGVAQNQSWGRSDWAPWLLWCAAMLSWFALFQWFRRFYLHPDEKRESVLRSWFATILTAPVYARAGLITIFGQNLNYQVTRKGRLRSRDTLGTFNTHLTWAAALLSALVISVATGLGTSAALFWAVASLSICAIPPAGNLIGRVMQPDASFAPTPFRGARNRIHQLLSRLFRARWRPDLLVPREAAENHDHHSSIELPP